jgi:hypothetical protein
MRNLRGIRLERRDQFGRLAAGASCVMPDGKTEARRGLQIAKRKMQMAKWGAAGEFRSTDTLFALKWHESRRVVKAEVVGRLMVSGARGGAFRSTRVWNGKGAMGTATTGRGIVAGGAKLIKVAGASLALKCERK